MGSVRATMCKPVFALGLLFILMAVALVADPNLLVDAADWESRGGQYLAGAIRVGVGLVLALFAPSTRYPKGLRIFGIVLVVAGVGVVLLPNEIWAGFMAHWHGENLIAVQIGGGVVGLLFGGFLMHASRPEGASV